MAAAHNVECSFHLFAENKTMINDVFFFLDWLSITFKGMYKNQLSLIELAFFSVYVMV